MEFEKLQTASLKELFISSVEDKILSGELPIGAQLPTERELAEMMDVSRGVVNSGIAEMAHKGFFRGATPGGHLCGRLSPSGQVGYFSVHYAL